MSTHKLIDQWTGKRIDHHTDTLPSLAHETCEECGAGIINRCLACGAPQCCPGCCAEEPAEDPTDAD